MGGAGACAGTGAGNAEKDTPPRPLSGAGRGKGPGARVFRGPVRPVTNSISDALDAPKAYHKLCRCGRSMCYDYGKLESIPTALHKQIQN